MHAPKGIRPCRFPLPEAAEGYITNIEKALYGRADLPAFMKRGDSGKDCQCWHSRIERGGRYVYGLGVE